MYGREREQEVLGTFFTLAKMSKSFRIEAGMKRCPLQKSQILRSLKIMYVIIVIFILSRMA